MLTVKFAKCFSFSTEILLQRYVFYGIACSHEIEVVCCLIAHSFPIPKNRLDFFKTLLILKLINSNLEK